MSKQPTDFPARVLVVDDDVRYGEWLRHHLDVLCPHTSVSLLSRSEFELWCTTFSGRDCHLVLLAATFGSSPDDPQSQGLSLLRRLRAQPVTPGVIALAEDGNELTAVRALHLGALDYLPKPARRPMPAPRSMPAPRRAPARRAMPRGRTARPPRMLHRQPRQRRGRERRPTPRPRPTRARPKCCRARAWRRCSRERTPSSFRATRCASRSASRRRRWSISPRAPGADTTSRSR